MLLLKSGSSRGEVFHHQVPIMFLPAGGKVLRLSLGESGVVEDEFGSGSLFSELELRNRVFAWIPDHDTPSLDNPPVGHEFNMPAHNMTGEQGEGAAHVRADLRRFILHGEAAEFDDLVELIG